MPAIAVTEVMVWYMMLSSNVAMGLFLDKKKYRQASVVFLLTLGLLFIYPVLLDAPGPFLDDPPSIIAHHAEIVRWIRAVSGFHIFLGSLFVLIHFYEKRRRIRQLS